MLQLPALWLGINSGLMGHLSSSWTSRMSLQILDQVFCDGCLTNYKMYTKLIVKHKGPSQNYCYPLTGTKKPCLTQDQLVSIHFAHIMHLYSQTESTRTNMGFPVFFCEWTLVVWALNWPNPRLNKVNKVIGTNHNCDPVRLSHWHQCRSLVSIAPCWSTWPGSLPSLSSSLALAPWALWLVKVIGV